LREIKRKKRKNSSNCMRGTYWGGVGPGQNRDQEMKVQMERKGREKMSGSRRGGG